MHLPAPGAARSVAARTAWAVAARTAWAVAACAAGTQPARAQLYGAQPATGVDAARVGDLRGTLESYLPNALPRTPGPAFQFTPSIGVDVGVTDNAYRTNGRRQADVFTLITPAFLVSADTAHIQANASYTPAISVYANNASQTRVDHFGQAGALITFIPDTLFLDLRGSISESSLAGGFGTSDGRGFNQSNQVTNIVLSATPYVQHRFGGWGTGLLSYTIAQTFQDSPVNNVTSGNTGLPVYYGVNGDLTTQREFASFTTGENFGRINSTTTVSATQYSGSGSYSGAYRNEVSETVGYALTRTFTPLVTLGYQDLHYGGTPPYNLSGILWSVGGRYTPNPNLSVTLTYGRRDGLDDFNADAAWYPTARTAVFLRYSTGLTSDAEGAQSILSTTNVGSTGLLTDRTTGAPVSSGNGFFGTQNNVFQVQRLSVSGLLNLNRDSFSASVTNERRTSVNATALNIASTSGQTVVPAGTMTTGTYGTLTWGHQLSDRLTSTVTGGYGVNDNGNALGFGSGKQTSFTGTAGLNYVFTETLTGRVLYSHTSVSGNGLSSFNNNGFVSRTGSYDENVLLAGVRKSF